jgi:L-gulonolactone oxidase
LDRDRAVQVRPSVVISRLTRFLPKKKKKNRPYGFNVPYRALFERFERILTSHHGRPHWAKPHGLRPDALSVLYPRFESFRKLLNDVDPDGRFRNEYVSRHIFGASDARFGERVFKAHP